MLLPLHSHRSCSKSRLYLTSQPEVSPIRCCLEGHVLQQMRYSCSISTVSARKGNLSAPVSPGCSCMAKLACIRVKGALLLTCLVGALIDAA